MVTCSASGCNERSSGWSKNKKKAEKVSWFQFPLTEPCRLKLWVQRVGFKDWKPTQSSKLCGKHFEECMFVEDLQLKYLGIAQKAVKLVKDAVPTKFYRDELGHWLVGAPSKTPSAAVPVTDADSSVAMAAAEAGGAPPRERTHTLKRLARMEQKRMIDDLLADKEQPPAPKAAKKMAKKAPCTTATNISEMAATPALTEAQCPTTKIYQVYPDVVYGDPEVIRKDHAYAPNPMAVRYQSKKLPTQPCPSSPPQSHTEGPMHETSTHSPLFNSDVSTEEYSSTQESNTKGGCSDADYSPHYSEAESEDISDDDEEPPLNDTTYFVYDSSLQQLMKKCQECGQPIISKKATPTGTLVTYSLSCLGGHTVIWKSQPLVRQMPLGNLMLAAAVLFTGLTYKRLEALSKAVNLEIFSKTMFNDTQRDKLFPVIQDSWREERSKVVSQCASPVILSGDSRSDSPGHNAKYGTYTLMECAKGQDEVPKILSLQLVQCTEVNNSNGMEPEGLQRCLRELKDEVKIDTLVTDRHPTIRKIMRTEHDEIKHEFDVWHVSKGIGKKLNAKAACSKNSDLLPWIQCILNHFWWSCATCNGDAQDLRERWISILHHVVNKHRWSGGVKFKRCQHSRLTAAASRKKAWLDPESSSFEALQEIVMNKQLLDSLPHLVQFQHTGSLEVFHNLILKYSPKRQHFGYKGMTARMMLAGLDWESMEREVVRNADGTERLDQVFSKRRKVWVVRRRYKRKSGQQVEHLMKKTIKVYREKIVLPPIVSPSLPSNISRQDKPNQKDAEARHRSRFPQN